MGGFLTNGFYEGNVQEESEGFLSLEDEAAPPLEIKQRKPRKPLSKLMKPLFDSFAPDESQSMDMLVLVNTVAIKAYAGQYETWIALIAHPRQ